MDVSDENLKKAKSIDVRMEERSDDQRGYTLVKLYARRIAPSIIQTLFFGRRSPLFAAQDVPGVRERQILQERRGRRRKARRDRHKRAVA